ncbi:cell cycle control protein 50C isoform X1 [Microcaecilia unicolor]|uniref:Cell cycle control protein n=1 Tax=Microcaecilia unicolor TaxID=1415580 RepID=A0A6P7Y4B0_9AMPH|nr:cell cycle control protein 50C-like isoform X1 [Microcaecilia unicolor]
MKNKNTSKAQQPPPSKCPDNSAFKQQRVPAWRPILSAQSVLLSFFGIGIFCLIVGICVIIFTTNVQEIKITYSDSCSNCSKLRENSSNSEKGCPCAVHFSLRESIQGDVFMYYSLINFYQNHRRYVISRDDQQLLGQNITNNHQALESKCAPFSTYSNGSIMAPCGAIANSMFNDTIQLYYHPNAFTPIEVPLLKTGNSWWTDKNVKFRNPKSDGNLPQAFAGTSRPPYWQKPVYALDTTDEHNNGYVNDDFLVWMRVAAFPTFRKLYRRLSRIAEFTEGLPQGNYSLNISYNFPVSKFRGKKQVILSTVTWCGGSNLFLGIAYTVSGAVTILATFVMLAVHLKFRKKLTYSEH